VADERNNMPKTPQLVCQHLENISRDALEKYLPIIRRYVVRRQGVYALYRRGKLYYVGDGRQLELPVDDNYSSLLEKN